MPSVLVQGTRTRWTVTLERTYTLRSTSSGPAKGIFVVARVILRNSGRVGAQPGFDLIEEAVDRQGRAYGDDGAADGDIAYADPSVGNDLVFLAPGHAVHTVYAFDVPHVATGVRFVAGPFDAGGNNSTLSPLFPLTSGAVLGAPEAPRRSPYAPVALDGERARWSFSLARLALTDHLSGVLDGNIKPRGRFAVVILNVRNTSRTTRSLDIDVDTQLADDQGRIYLPNVYHNVDASYQYHTDTNTSDIRPGATAMISYLFDVARNAHGFRFLAGPFIIDALGNIGSALAYPLVLPLGR